MLYLQRTAGNGAVGALLARMDSSRPVPTLPSNGNGTWLAATRPAVQRQVGAAAEATGTSADAPAAAGGSVTMGTFTVTTYDALLAAAKFLTTQLTTAETDVPDGEPSKAAADSLIKQEQDWEPTLQGKGTDPIDQPTVDQATHWYTTYVQAQKDLETYKKGNASTSLKAGDSSVVMAQQGADAMPDQMADAKRGAFVAKRDDILEQITNTLGKALLVSSTLLGVHEKCMEMVGWLSDETTRVDDLVEKFGPIAEGAHAAIAAYEALGATLTIVGEGEGSTAIDQETSKANAGLTLASAAGSLTGMASAYGFYFSALLSVGQVCIKAVGDMFREDSHRWNVIFLAAGALDKVDWTAEPGGREAYDFMVTVMHAGSSKDIPTPVPAAMDALLTDRRESFQKGSGGNEVPTEGYWLWRKTDPNKIAFWLIQNRTSVWAMMYGAVDVPS
jgi:hypothetical protein